MSRGFLVDTSVLSATALDRRDVPEPAKQAARQWIKQHEAHLWLSVVTVAEIAAGVGEREAAGETQYAAQLSAWLRAILMAYPARILNYGIAEALCCRQMAFTARRNGIQIGFADMSVASIAVNNDLVVATRNTEQFSPLGADVVNPFADGT